MAETELMKTRPAGSALMSEYGVEVKSYDVLGEDAVVITVNFADAWFAGIGLDEHGVFAINYADSHKSAFKATMQQVDARQSE
jgi:hypothetical protein